MRKHHRGTIASSLATAALLAVAGPAAAQTASSTTTTTFGGTTTTTMFEPVDVTGGGRFEGGFPKGSFDAFSFELTEPRVLVAEVTNGLGDCPGDSIVELRRPGSPGNCGGVYGDDLLCMAVDDDSGITLCSRLVYYVSQPGEYEIRVSAYAGKQILRYFLDVAFTTSTTTTKPAVVCGDVIADDQVKSSDALAVLKAAVGDDQCAAMPCVCDANGNGAIQASDALLVLKKAVGSPANMMCPC